MAGYAGSGTGSILESALNGPMATMAPPDEKAILLNWVKEGATRSAYESTIKPIIDKRCMSCHDGSNPNIPNLTGFDNLHKVTALNTGASIATLVRDSHIHFFGLSFIFFIVGLIFSHAYVRPIWFKCAVIALPFLGILVDVSSWYMIKVFHPFAWAEIAAGALMAACFAVMWLSRCTRCGSISRPRPFSANGRRHSEIIGRSIENAGQLCEDHDKEREGHA